VRGRGGHNQGRKDQKVAGNGERREEHELSTYKYQLPSLPLLSKAQN